MLKSEIIVDNFAGGGGASTGIEAAIGRPVDVAINHNDEALAMHRANHPATMHYCQNIWRVDPREVARGRPVGLSWFSPDCKHFSKAKGGKPVEKRIRDLAWVVVHWARLVRPRIIMLENVEEFQDWGPLVEVADGQMMPCPLRKGLTFRRWVRELEKLGYRVEWQELRACDYGAPTIRKRLFLIARLDRSPIVWPAASHGAGLTPYRVAAECIDWSIPCPSIFERERPLVENTMARIARGMWRYVLTAGEPFIVPVTHHGDARVHPIDEPLRTITTAQRGEHALVVPTLVQTGYGEREGQAPRALDIGRPLGTVVAGGSKHALVAAFLTKFRNNSVGSAMDEPMHTVTANSFIRRPGGAAPHGLVAASLVKFKGTCPDGQPATEPLATVQAGGQHHALVSAFLEQANTGLIGHDAREPVSTIVGKGCTQRLVQAFLIKYYGEGGQDQSIGGPMHTLTTKARMGLVTIAGTDWQIVDIGMRMLTPRELFRAQGFGDDYVIDPIYNGKPLTKTAQIRMCGNSVCPPVAQALVAANYESAASVAA